MIRMPLIFRHFRDYVHVGNIYLRNNLSSLICILLALVDLVVETAPAANSILAVRGTFYPTIAPIHYRASKKSLQHKQQFIYLV